MTTANYTYHYTSVNVNETSAITFEVKTRSSPRIGLFADIKRSFKGEQFYEVLIGYSSGTQSGLRKTGLGNIIYSTVASANSILSETEFRNFWISWADNIISVGHGNIIGQDLIMSYDDSSSPYAINYMAFSSYETMVAEWKYHTGNTMYLLFFF